MVNGLADTAGGRQFGRRAGEAGDGENTARLESERLCHAVPADTVNGFWREADWLLCRDEKWRPVEPGAFPLADGIAARVGRLRAYGNTLNAPQAQNFIAACMHALTLDTAKTIPLPDVIMTPFEQEVSA